MTLVAEKFALMWVVCLNTSKMLETATDDFSSIIFALFDCAEKKRISSARQAERRMTKEQ